MTTANDIITGAFQDAGIAPSETPLEAFEISDGLTVLNDMLSEWELSGLGLGAVPVENDTDIVRIQRGHVAAVKHQVALRLLSMYQKPLSLELSGKANASWESLLKSVAIIGEVALPDTLPRGRRCLDISDNVFFSKNKSKNF